MPFASPLNLDGIPPSGGIKGLLVVLLVLGRFDAVDEQVDVGVALFRLESLEPSLDLTIDHLGAFGLGLLHVGLECLDGLLRHPDRKVGTVVFAGALSVLIHFLARDAGPVSEEVFLFILLSEYTHILHVIPLWKRRFPGVSAGYIIMVIYKDLQNVIICINTC